MVAVLAGARTTVEVAEHVGDLTAGQRARIGLTWKSAPNLSTLRRFLLVLDKEVLQTALTTWAKAHADRVTATQQALRHFAVDGKSLRGAAGKGCPKPHVLGVLDVGAAVFLTQRQIDAKTNEIGMFTKLMDQIDTLDGVLVSADAMHAQTGHAAYLDARAHGRTEKRVVQVTAIGHDDDQIAFPLARNPEHAITLPTSTNPTLN